MSSHPAYRPVFIGRADEIAQLRAALEHARSGRGRLVLLSGPPGIGKSRLAAEFIEEVSEAGVRVLVGRSWEAGGAPAYWPWVQAFRGYVRTADTSVLKRQLTTGAAEMLALLPELGDLIEAVPAPQGNDPVSDRFQLFEAGLTFVQNLARVDPLVVVLEDLQAADVPSLLLLEFVSNHLAESGILVVATYRDFELTSEHPLSGTIAELHRLPVTTEIALDGLDADEVTSFLEATAGPVVASTLSVSLHQRTSGNPLFLSEAVRLMAAGSKDGSLASSVRVAIPTEIRKVIQRRLDVLSLECKAILESLSVLGNEFDLEIAAKYAGVTVDELLDSLGEAVNAGLVLESQGGPGTVGFAHDLVRHTLYASLSPAARVRSHRSAAAVLEATYADDVTDHLAELALHYFEAVAGGDHVKAIEYGRLAGEQALHRLAYEEAVRLFEMTVQTVEGSENPDRAPLGPLLLALGDARVRAGDLTGAGRAFLRAADVARRSGDTRLMGLAAAGYGGRFVWARAGNDKEMIPLLQDALVMLGGEDDALRVRLLSRLACATRSGDRDHSAALGRQAVQLARQQNDPATLVYALSGLAGAIWWPETSEERLELGRELVDVGQSTGLIDGLVDGHMTLCAGFAEIGDFAAARHELRLLSQAGGSLGLSSQRWLEGAMSAVFALSDGRFEEAEPLVEEMLRQPPVTPARDNVSAALFQRFLLRREQGRLLEIEESVRSAATDFTWYQFHQLALAELLRLTGRVAEARAMIDELAADDFDRFRRDNYWLLSMCLASELVVGLGAEELAPQMIERLTPFSDMCAVGFPEGSLGSVSRYLGLLSGAVGDHESAIAWLEMSIALNGRNGARPWVAHTHYELARILRERGRQSDAAEALRHLGIAEKICDEVGLIALQGAVQTALEPYATAVASEPIPAMFRRDGEYFTISFNGAGFQLKDTKGLRYLGMLLASPGREIHVLDLVVGAEGVDPSSRGRVGEVFESAETSTGPVIDRQARDVYESRLIDLEEELAEAERLGDEGRAAAARIEQDFLASELASALGLGGRERNVADAAERARVNVTRTIRAALAKIDSHDPLLGRHLDATIRTGIFCSYTPDPVNPVGWTSAIVRSDVRSR